MKKHQMIIGNPTLFRNIAIVIFLLFISKTGAQEIDILIRNGHVFDWANGIDGVMDVAVFEGKIQQVAPNIPERGAKTIIDASGLYVSPGLIDPHTHVFVGPTARKFANGTYSLSPDDFSFRSGVTTVVDAGTSGWRNFSLFKEQVIDQSQTRILAFLNIAAYGLSGDDRQNDLQEMNVGKSIAMIRQFPDVLVGVKIGHYDGSDWAPFDRAIEVGNQTDTPLLVECHLPGYSLEDQLTRMRPGDIITHSFENITERRPIVNEKGKLLSVVWEARKKGVLFDVGHGGAGFWFNQGIPAGEQGFWPDSFGTDLHRFSMNAGMKDMLNVMSKFLNMGMPLKEVLSKGSWYPAQAMKRTDLGNLSVGSIADIAILRLKEGDFGYVDARNNLLKGTLKLEAEVTIRNGKVVWDLNGLSARPWTEHPREN